MGKLLSCFFSLHVSMDLRFLRISVEIGRMVSADTDSVAKSRYNLWIPSDLIEGEQVGTNGKYCV
jgi:hypothetical protein